MKYILQSNRSGDQLVYEHLVDQLKYHILRNIRYVK